MRCRALEGGHTVTIEGAGQQLTCVLNEDEHIADSRSLYFNRMSPVAARCKSRKPASIGSISSQCI